MLGSLVLKSMLLGQGLGGLMFAADKLLSLEAPWWGYAAFSLVVMGAMELLAVLVPYVGRGWLRLQVSST